MSNTHDLQQVSLLVGQLQEVLRQHQVEEYLLLIPGESGLITVRGPQQDFFTDISILVDAEARVKSDHGMFTNDDMLVLEEDLPETTSDEFIITEYDLDEKPEE